MTRIRIALTVTCVGLAALAPFVHVASRIDGPGALLSGFLALVVVGSASALAVVLADAAGSAPRRPLPARAPVSSRAARERGGLLH
jgi:hypothetical protein